MRRVRVEALYLPTLGNTQLIQTQGFGQGLLREGLGGEYGCETIGSFDALRRVEQDELLNVLKFLQQLFEGNPVPSSLRLFVNVL